MNLFTHAYNFVSPAMCQKLQRSADQSVPHEHILLTRKSMLLFIELWFDDKNFF